MKMHDVELPDGVVASVGNTPEQTAMELAEVVAGWLGHRLKLAARASLAVSGGSTPVPFFRLLSEQALDWSRVDVLLVDERWVDETDPASNTRLVKEHLLQGSAASARFLSIRQPGATPSESISAVESELESLALPLDVLVLGMGSDGHTASLFPDAPELAGAMNPEGQGVVAAMTPASQPHARITLTWPILSKARFTALHLKGYDKLSTLRQALAHPEDQAVMPIRGFLRPGLQIFWSP
jgi:6-phosphogluconolactonase